LAPYTELEEAYQDEQVGDGGKPPEYLKIHERLLSR